jgi:hypothetical protein
VKLKVHQGFVLCTSCVPDKVAVNQKVENKKLYSIRKKGQTCLTSDLQGLKLGGGVNWTGFEAKRHKTRLWCIRFCIIVAYCKLNFFIPKMLRCVIVLKRPSFCI